MTMSDSIWCHGPHCHTYSTQDRIRGAKGSKVLRTKKVKQHTDSSWYRPNNFYNYFCSQGCYNDFAHHHAQQIIAIAPRREPLETRIDVVKEEREGWRGTYTETVINKIDNTQSIE